jgi:carbon storage regulator CsrA
MLILNRKPGQSFFITNEIKIIVLDGIGDISIGIDAPKNMSILRSELLRRYRNLNHFPGICQLAP